MTRKRRSTLRRTRIILSTLFFAVLTSLFMFPGSGGFYHESVSPVAKIQLFPAMMSLSAGVLLFWLAATLLFGRLYCSSVCPIGYLQDFFAWIHKKAGRKKGRKFHHSYSSPKNLLRYAVLSAVLVCAVAGVAIVPMLLDPYSAYGRIATLFSNVVNPHAGAYALLSLSGVCVGVVTFFVVAAVSYWRGRLVCNTICPVGSTLSLVSRYSVWKMEIDTDVCIGCGACSLVCKAECINQQDHLIDPARCVMCFNCIDACTTGAIRYVPTRKRLSSPLMQQIPDLSSPARVDAVHDVAEMSRRDFLKISGAVAGVVVASTPVAKAIGMGREKKQLPVIPPGARSRSDFLNRCTACMLCVNNCPQQIIKPSSGEHGLMHILQPRLDFSRGACENGCTICSNICPSGALKPLKPGGKWNSPIGIAHVDTSVCWSCGKCVSLCPNGALSMSGGSPVVDAEKCVGCGLCEYNCPVRPEKAIKIEGI